MSDKRKPGEIIKDRHEEASEVKQCYTDFAFKGLLLASAFFGIIIKFYPINVQSCIPYFLTWAFCWVTIIVLIRIYQIGLHKYGTANRNYGYVLHLDRTWDYEEKTGKELEKKIREVGWEEAMFAWRVIQPILYEEIYRFRTIGERILFSVVNYERKPEKVYCWWNTERLMNTKPGKEEEKRDNYSFHPGTYLEKSQRLIYTICILIYLVFLLSYIYECNCIYKHLSASISFLPKIWFMFFYWIVLILLSIKLFDKMLRQNRRRQILERGLLSIQSCAVVWRLVVLSHLAVTEELKHDYKGYTRGLVNKAKIIIKNGISDIHKEIMIGIWPKQDENVIKGES